MLQLPDSSFHPPPTAPSIGTMRTHCRMDPLEITGVYRHQPNPDAVGNFGHMPPKEGLTPEDVGHIIAYVRREQRRARIQ